MRANQPPRQFSSWHPLDRESIEAAAPEAPAAIQVRITGGLLDYPEGQSAMVCYLYATESAREAMREFFAEELADPGSAGFDELEFRTFAGRDARDWMTKLMFKFESKFGSLPRMNRRTDEQTQDTNPTE